MRAPFALLVGCAVLMAAAPGAGAVSTLANPPPGANDFSCKPSAERPNPVVLVHGTGFRMEENWSYMSPLLKDRGWCVFALTYGLDPRFAGPGGRGGVIPIEQSAAELGVFVDRVLRETGARQVDLFGHSQGTFMPQHWLKFLGGAAKVERYVAAAALYDGTRVAANDQLQALGRPYGLSQPVIDLFSQFCAACAQLFHGSETQQRLAAGGAAAPGVEYTTILTKYDELVIPYTSGLLPPPAKNRVLQDICPANPSEHMLVVFDPVVAQLAFNGLDPASERAVDCNRLPPEAGRVRSRRGAGGDSGARSVGARLSSRVARFRVRKLTLSRVPATASVRVGCSGRSCAFRSKQSKGRSRRALAGLFRGRRLSPGTVITVRVSAPGLRGRLFRLAVRRSGRARSSRSELGVGR